MPLLDIAVAQSSFRNYLGHPRVQWFVDGKVPNYSLLKYEERWTSFKKSLQNPGNLKLNLGHRMKPHRTFLIKSVATLEPKYHVQNKDGGKENVLLSTVESVSSTIHTESSSRDSEEVDEREKLRRMRISKANKGNTPWNKGRKHSPETLQRIRERTKLAMQNPKVKMKLANIGHAQSEETRVKIAVGVRMGWQRRREKLLVQETCLFDWQNIIAEAARKGFHEEDELQWDSYKILNEQLQQEWLNSIEYRKTMRKPKGSKRAPKSPEQRRKIAEAIAAKWADPEYRSRVCTGLAKYHGTPEGAERKARRKPSGEARSTRTTKKKGSEARTSAAGEIKVRPQQPKLKRRNAPKYKDPLANHKLQMLKSIRAQRVTSETKKNEALQRAKLLIAEAEKAAKALEVAATRSPVAQASLIETRKLIAEAIQSIESIENGEPPSQDEASPEHQNNVENSAETLTEDAIANKNSQNGVNGIASVQSSKTKNPEFNLYNLSMLEEMDMNYRLPTSLNHYELPKLDLERLIRNPDSRELVERCHTEPNGDVRLNGVSSHPPAKTVMKKWVRGRLVEVVEGG